MFAVNGILFNHESPRRGETFVTRKITRAVAAIKAGKQDYVYMGNLDAVRDWGYAAEYVEGMWRMLQADEPDDYVLATGVGITVRDFLEISFEHAGLDWEKHVRFDERYLRPTEVDALIGDATQGARRARLEGHGRRPRARPAHGRRRHRGARARGHAVDRRGEPRRRGGRPRDGRPTDCDFTPGELDRDATFYVAGHRGLVGSAIVRRLEAAGFDEPRRARPRPSST